MRCVNFDMSRRERTFSPHCHWVYNFLLCEHGDGELRRRAAGLSFVSAARIRFQSDLVRVSCSTPHSAFSERVEPCKGVAHRFGVILSTDDNRTVRMEISLLFSETHTHARTHAQSCRHACVLCVAPLPGVCMNARS